MRVAVAPGVLVGVSVFGHTQETGHSGRCHC